MSTIHFIIKSAEKEAFKKFYSLAIKMKLICPFSVHGWPNTREIFKLSLCPSVPNYHRCDLTWHIHWAELLLDSHWQSPRHSPTPIVLSVDPYLNCPLYCIFGNFQFLFYMLLDIHCLQSPVEPRTRSIV